VSSDYSLNYQLNGIFDIHINILAPRVALFLDILILITYDPASQYNAYPRPQRGPDNLPKKGNMILTSGEYTDLNGCLML